MEFKTATNLSQAAELKYQFPRFQILAGGTDLCVQLNGGVLKSEGLINIFGIKELSAITENENNIEIGALATHTQIIESDLIQRFILPLVEACRSIGARQIQNRGTIGGNVMNASPAGDTLPVLLAFDAEIELVSINKTRRVPFDQFYLGYKKTVVAEDEILSKVVIPRPSTQSKGGFFKIGTRKAQAISKIMACFRVNLDSGLITDSRIAYGSVAPVPLRIKELEEYLKGRKPNKATITKSLDLLKGAIKPIDDIRSTAAYRIHLCQVILKRFLRSLI